MRKHGSKWVLGFLVVIISVVFIFTFGFGNKGQVDPTVAKVGSHEITRMEYNRAMKNALDAMRQRGRSVSDEDRAKLREAVLSDLVDRYVLVQKATEMGLSVSDREYVDNLMGQGLVKKDGTFDRETYLQYVRRTGIDLETFEKNERQMMLIGRLINIIQDNAPTSADEKSLFEEYIKRRGQVRFSVAVFDPEQHKNKVTVDDRELSDLYEREKNTYKSENTLHLVYLAIGDKSGVKDDQVYMDLLKAKDLAAYGKAKGLEVIDPGTLKESEIVSRFPKLKMQEGLKGLAKGDVTLPMRTDNTSFIFQVVDRQDGKLLDKDDAIKAIRARVVAEKARTTARTMAEAAVKDKGLKFTRTTEFVPRSSDAIPGIGPIPPDSSALFALSAGQVFERPVAIDGKYYVFAYADEKQPDKAEWDKEKQIFKQVYINIGKNAYFAAFKDDLKKAAKVKYSLKDM
jgi:parvulin-like peptidyl-prolyl isomerase